MCNSISVANAEGRHSCVLSLQGLTFADLDLLDVSVSSATGLADAIINQDHPLAFASSYQVTSSYPGLKFIP